MERKGTLPFQDCTEKQERKTRRSFAKDRVCVLTLEEDAMGSVFNPIVTRLVTFFNVTPKTNAIDVPMEEEEKT